MAENVEWINATCDLLDVIDSSVYKSITDLQPTKSIKTYQYGDTINFFADDPHTLMRVGVILQKDLFAKNHMAQMALSCGGVYDLTGSEHLQRLGRLHNGLALQVLIGRAISRAHLILRRVKGPRIILDEKCHVSDDPPHWERFRHPKVVLPDVGFPRSEVAWWRAVIDIDDDVQQRIKDLAHEIGIREVANPRQDPIEIRRIGSLKKRKEQWEEFLNVLTHDNPEAV